MIRRRIKPLPSVVTAVIELHLRVVAVAALLGRNAQFIPPLGKPGTRHMVVKVSTLGHFIKQL
ncbi:MAG: hypothetical protein EBY50_07385, partial [Rhodobacteraceae bacterium]|nr:hypothetical protein [Paracoccaceae bacterium]